MHKRYWRIVGLCGVAFTGCGDDGGGVSASSTGGGPGGTSQTATDDTPTTDPPTSTAPPLTTSGEASTTAATGGTGSTSEPVATGTGTGATDTGELPCGGCPPNFICKYDQCLPDLGPCRSHDDCPGDSYCDMDGVCIPYDVPMGVINDPNCKKDNIPGGIKPEQQCEWNGAVKDPQNDKTAKSTYIYTTPMVADLNLDKDPQKLQPSIIVSTFETLPNVGRIGTLRVFDGRTCGEQLRAGGADEQDDANRPAYAVPWAIGDLDADVPNGGHPELVGYHRVTSANDTGPVHLYAFRINSADPTPVLERMWYGRTCEDDKLLTFGSANMLAGPMLHDLDDDEYPEIVVGDMVFDHNGCLLTTWAPNFTGLMPVIADVDLDGVVDLVTNRRTAAWDPITSEWVNKPWFVADPPKQLSGYMSLANFGAYTQIQGLDTDQLPELAVLSVVNAVGRLRIQSLDGKTVWGPVNLYAKNGEVVGSGGTVTISDFDGDGQVEMATAAATYYAVYDPDCVAALMGASPPERPGGTCERSPEQEAKKLPDGVLWVQPSQDLSSNVTGSSIFDFDGDGQAEAVYRDECFIRVYNGRTGEVIYSAPASSGTGAEYPAVADVDGDFATEIVVPARPTTPARRSTRSSRCPAISWPAPASSSTATQWTAGPIHARCGISTPITSPTFPTLPPFPRPARPRTIGRSPASTTSARTPRAASAPSTSPTSPSS
ncbi:MAG: hypothetical protein IPO88_20935 [Nannocystis sp.]|uniref:hypothetical protein n=1 Tax=Nannocystis sp. TaxID=1962667 RepID=UPI002424AFFF|nr:hypothetical protein [Nannocystis sp.]MBK9755918.1 hypothetical protein [Nannocystis sp.]